MNIEALRNIIHREVWRVLARQVRPVPCIVDSYNPSQHTVKVKLQPEGTLTGWVQIKCDQVGWQVAPNIGDPGWLEFHESDKRAAVFTGSNHNDLKPPPAQIAAGELRYQHASGSFFYFKNDGSVTITDKAGSTAVLDGAGNAEITAKSIQLGDGGTLQKLMTATAMAVYNQHTHPSNGSPPAQQMTAAADLTSVLQAQ